MRCEQVGHQVRKYLTKKWGVDLIDFRNTKGQSAYDRWMQLVGEVTVGGHTLRSRLSRLISSSKYQKLATEGIAELGEDSPRVAEIRKVVTQYRGKAQARMLLEFPELAEQVRAKMLAQRALSTGESALSINARLGR